MGTTSPSVTPLMATALTFTGSNPTLLAARMPSITCSNPVRRVSSRNFAGSIVSRLTLIRRRPASQSACAIGASKIPLVVKPTSRMPSTAAILSTSRGKSRRTRGSPPVSRTLSIPHDAATLTNRSISSNVSRLVRGKNSTSSGMQ